MKHNFSRSSRLFLAVGLLIGCSSLPIPVSASRYGQQSAPDNTKTNKDQSGPTADQQKMNPADREITQKIRKAVEGDKSLSTYAHNIKIITQDGEVTLRGPVRSEAEKSNLEAKAISIAGADKVTNQLEIAPSK
jgi:hyperosmotically inducible protein